MIENSNSNNSIITGDDDEWCGNKVSSKYIKKSIEGLLEKRFSSVAVVATLSDTERLILAFCYKSGKKAVTLARMTNRSIERIHHVLSNLKQRGLIQTKSFDAEKNVKYYIFEPEPDVLKSLPEDLIHFIERKESEMK